ncbi:DUF5995 family protein [Streptomyces sp. NPDC060194]|uniref:DUF5995 family protein n=1 Tax=Streptomyces sp. NPDC060194 TaxID=3347069 RepID=UPI00365B1383
MAQTEQFTAGPGNATGRMPAFRAAWPQNDGLAVFDRVYRAVTESAAAGVDGAPPRHPPAAGLLGVRLAERYAAVLDAAAGGGGPPASWRPLLRSRHHPGIAPAQFALAGINAHVGYDLPLALVRVCRDLGCGPAGLEDAFDRVGDVLVGLEERIRDELAPGPELLLLTDPLTHLLASWSLDRARDAAWSTARILWGLGRLPQLAAEFTERTDASVGLVGRVLLTPLDR